MTRFSDSSQFYSVSRFFSSRFFPPRFIPVYSRSAHLVLLMAIVVAACNSHGMAQNVQVTGKILDAVTEKPIEKFMIQAGRVDAKTGKTTWGFSSSTSSSKTGSFRYTLRPGWTARVIVDGYTPQPFEAQAARPDGIPVELVLKMKPGKPITGRVVDHEGRAVAGIRVYTISPRRLNLFGGIALGAFDDKEDKRAKYVETQKDGFFKIAGGMDDRVALTGKQIDCWSVKIDPDKENLITLPKPTDLKIEYDIPGAPKHGKIFFQLLTHLTDGFDGTGCTATLELKNGSAMELDSLPPGKYQFCRRVMHSFDMIGMSAMMDREFVELKPGKPLVLSYKRPQGRSVSGMVRWSEDESLGGVIVKVEELDKRDGPWKKHKLQTVFDSQLIAGKPQQGRIPTQEAAFKTVPLSPGKYRLRVIAYATMTDAGARLSGLTRPKYEVVKEITVSEKGAPNMLILELK